MSDNPGSVTSNQQCKHGLGPFVLPDTCPYCHIESLLASLRRIEDRSHTLSDADDEQALFDIGEIANEALSGTEDGPRCGACGHLDRYHFDDGHGNVVCRFLSDCACVHRERAVEPSAAETTTNDLFRNLVSALILTTESRYLTSHVNFALSEARKHLGGSYLPIEPSAPETTELPPGLRDPIRVMSVMDAMNIAEGVLNQYKVDHPKWWKRMDGTPILNDIVVRMAKAFAPPTRESPLAAAVRIARGDVGPPTEPVRFAEETSADRCRDDKFFDGRLVQCCQVEGHGGMHAASINGVTEQWISEKASTDPTGD